MYHDLHTKQNKSETDSVEKRTFCSDTMRAVPHLRHVIVECDDWACEVQGRIHSVCEVIAKTEVFSFCGDGDAVALGEVGGIKLFLLDVISLQEKGRGEMRTSTELPDRESTLQ